MSNTTQQDPHKHALYRPHMGDMTGWRFLEAQEKVQDHDEFILLQDDDEGWFATLHGGENKTAEQLCGPHSAAYRRRVAPAEKPTDQKRFVTVVIDTGNQEHWKWVQYAQLPYDRIREGNALAALDSIEERVVKAIREGGV